MKSLCLIVLLAACGCVNVERLAVQLGTNNASFYLEVPTAHGPIRISRAVPNIGFGVTVTDKGAVSVAVPTNVVQNVQYLVPYQGPAPTNSAKGKP